jgi:hypothetical protein
MMQFPLFGDFSALTNQTEAVMVVVMRHVPVIIVGGGPVGMVLAMSLSA